MSPHPGAACHEVRCTLAFYYPLSHRGYWIPRNHRALAVSDGIVWFLSERRPLFTNANSFIRLCTCPFYAVLALRIRTLARRHSRQFETGAPSLGFAFPFSDFSTRCCLMLQAFQLLQPVVRGVSHTFDEYPPCALRVYFTTQPLVGFTLQGVSLRCSLSDSSPDLCLLAGLLRVRCRCKHLLHEPNRRLQGFAPHRNTLSEQRGLTATTARTPLAFLLFQVLPSAIRTTAFTMTSAHDLDPQSTRYCVRVYSVLTNRSLSTLFRVRRPA